MFESLSLRARILCIFSAMALIVLCGVSSVLWSNYQNEILLNNLITKQIVLYKTAQDMELALANQKGFLTYYFIDGNVNWLNSLGEYRQMFTSSLALAGGHDLTTEQRQTFETIRRQYQQYLATKDRAIAQYAVDKTSSSISLPHEQQRDVFFNLLEQCRTFSHQQWIEIQKTEAAGRTKANRSRLLAYSAVTAFIAIGILFLFILYRQVLLPIRGLALKTGGSEALCRHDEIDSLKQSLQNMLRDHDETSDELAKSRKHLLQAERMAMVGELAASVAHTIRNPFTSIKMRMFSLSRSLDLNDVQNEDLLVISEEISRIDKIVQNFLEFARPPKLKLRNYSFEGVIQSVLTLLEYRIREFDVELVYEPSPDLPPVKMDGDRIKEAIVNLIINGCEATGHGGVVTITTSRERHSGVGWSVAVHVSDNGPGVPAAIAEKICTPFFTTKEDGSGLGLAIVTRIAQEHGGVFSIEANSDKGTRCSLYLPLETDGKNNESDTDH